MPDGPPVLGGKAPVLALDTEDHGGIRPGEQRGQDEAHALAGPGRRETQDVFRPTMTQIALHGGWLPA